MLVLFLAIGLLLGCCVFITTQFVSQFYPVRPRVNRAAMGQPMLTKVPRYPQVQEIERRIQAWREVVANADSVLSACGGKHYPLEWVWDYLLSPQGYYHRVEIRRRVSNYGTAIVVAKNVKEYACFQLEILRRERKKFSEERALVSVDV